MTVHNEIANSNVKINGIWPFPAAPLPDSMIDAFHAWSRLPDGLSSLTAKWTDDDRARLFSCAYRDARIAWENLAGEAFLQQKYGFIASFETPTYSVEGALSFGWHTTDSHIAYAESFPDLLSAIIERAAGQYDEAARMHAAIKVSPQQGRA